MIASTARVHEEGYFVEISLFCSWAAQSPEGNFR
jgi:hypothetical protein